ncbi:glucosyltransferase domain-containing protein [Aliarcobacter cryaerophilus]|uniref:glucosyltransferase domain-containing protein n=1 Tax=Aliarcobacter cryaerophilus TaxID=28198 RepID=UPI0015E867C7|nr:glucosyltransferase domain-containing protein [Aliarcobacter cryaerophilus]
MSEICKLFTNKSFVLNDKIIVYVKIFFAIYLINIIIYGQKIFFQNFACDDYTLFYSSGEEMASSGRWFGGLLSQYVFSKQLAVLPYLHGLLAIFSFTLSGFLTALFLGRNDKYSLAFITLIISTTPMVADILFFNMAIMGIIMMPVGIVGFMLLYNKNIYYKFLGLVFLIISIGSYQIYIQIILALIAVKALLDFISVTSLQEIKFIIKNSLFYVALVFIAFVASSFINSMYMEYFNIVPRERYSQALDIHNLNVYIDRIKSIYNLYLPLLYIEAPMLGYKILAALGIIGLYYATLTKKVENSYKLIVFIFISLLILIIPIIINLPNITGNSIPLRSHFTIGWIIAGFFIIQIVVFKGLLRQLSFFIAFLLLITQVYYINIFFDAATRQTNADINRANQIVNIIRMQENYEKEPMKFRIIGEKTFPVVGSHSYDLQALGTSWSKYSIFDKFTDFNYERMNDNEYNEIEKNIIEKGQIISSYPGKNSIFVSDNKVVLFLDTKSINNKILLKEVLKMKPTIEANFNISLEDKSIYYYKSPCSDEDIKNTFFLHLYPKNVEDIPKEEQQYGFKNLDFQFYSSGDKIENQCIAKVNLPEYKIKSVKTGQYHETIIDWEVEKSFE